MQNQLQNGAPCNSPELEAGKVSEEKESWIEGRGNSYGWSTTRTERPEEVARQKEKDVLSPRTNATGRDDLSLVPGKRSKTKDGFRPKKGERVKENLGSFGSDRNEAEGWVDHQGALRVGIAPGPRLLLYTPDWANETGGQELIGTDPGKQCLCVCIPHSTPLVFVTKRQNV